MLKIVVPDDFPQAITGTDPVEIARRNLWPTLLGFVGVVIAAIFML